MLSAPSSSPPNNACNWLRCPTVTTTTPTGNSTTAATKLTITHRRMSLTPPSRHRKQVTGTPQPAAPHPKELSSASEWAARPTDLADYQPHTVKHQIHFITSLPTDGNPIRVVAASVRDGTRSLQTWLHCT